MRAGWRTAVVGCAVLLGSCGAKVESGVTIMQWNDLLSRPLPKADATLAYGDDALQMVDIWQPEGDGPHPAVIMIHGGCWQTDIAERDIMNYIADDLRKRGIGVWNIEYRGVDRGGGFPGTYQDVGRAADLFAVQGAGYGFDTRRVVAIGHSAGGHLALWLANRPALPADAAVRGQTPIKVDVAISQGGLPDLAAAAALVDGACGQDAPRKMAGADRTLTSPPEMAVGGAQQWLFNTDMDRVAPPAFADAYARAMADKGVTVERRVTGGEGHVELIAPDSVSWKQQVDVIMSALGMK